MTQTLNISLRPKRFEDIIGNAKVVAALKKKLESGTVPNGFLLLGPPGVGKTTLARIIARFVQGSDFPEGQEPDYTEQNSGDKGGVDDARALVANSRLSSFSGKFKIITIDEAQQFTTAAQNTLLTEIERENSRTIWVFATTDSSKILPALKRRLYSITLKGLVDPEDRKTLIKRAVAALGFKATKEQLTEFWTALEGAQITSPGLIVMAVEKFASGIPADEAVYGAEHDPLYAEVAKSVLRGSWTKTQELLKQLKAVDVRGLRSVVAAFLKSRLLSDETQDYDRVSQALLSFGKYGTVYEDGIAYSVTTAQLYQICMLFGKK